MQQAAKFSTEALALTLGKVSVLAQKQAPGRDQNLFETGLLDSLSLIQFVLKIEEDFGIGFDYDDIKYDHFMTLSNLSELLSRKYA